MTQPLNITADYALIVPSTGEYQGYLYTSDGKLDSVIGAPSFNFFETDPTLVQALFEAEAAIAFSSYAQDIIDNVNILFGGTYYHVGELFFFRELFQDTFDGKQPLAETLTDLSDLEIAAPMLEFLEAEDAAAARGWMMSTGSNITDAAIDSPTNAETNAPTDAPTDLNVITTLLGALTGEVNSTNGRQNTIAAKVNANATKQNTIATNLNTFAGKFNAWLDAAEANNLLAA
jgi:hypothetical protein